MAAREEPVQAQQKLGFLTWAANVVPDFRFARNEAAHPWTYDCGPRARGRSFTFPEIAEGNCGELATCPAPTSPAQDHQAFPP